MQKKKIDPGSLSAFGILLLLIAGFTIAVWPREVIVKPVTPYWERSININVLRTVEKEGSSVPDGGREMSKRKVKRRSGPLKGARKTKYTYEIEEWQYHRTVTADGNDLNPRWPNYSLGEATGDHGTGQEAAGERSEKYAWTFVTQEEDEVQVVREYPLEEWASFDQNRQYIATRNWFDEFKIVKPLD